MSNGTNRSFITSTVVVAAVGSLIVACALIFVAGLMGQGTTTVTVSLPDAPTQVQEFSPPAGGNLTWTPPFTEVTTSGWSCQLLEKIGQSGSITLSVKDDVTYVDLQLPGELNNLTGILVGQNGGTYIAVPSFLREADVSTIVLGNQYEDRVNVYACYEF